MNSGVIHREKTQMSVKMQAVYALAAVVAAVTLPQICHAAGAGLGVGSALGEALLPMHFPVILVGLLAGPFAGAAAGALSPLVSFALTGMPHIAMLPFMVIELAVYGLAAGVLKNTAMPAVAQVALTQIIGRAVRAAAILVAVYGFSSSAVGVAVIWQSIAAGAVGIAVQLIGIPLIVKAAKKSGKYES